LLFLSCGKRGMVLSLEADPSLMPRLESIVAALPPPKAWTIASSADNPDYTLSLEARDDKDTTIAGASLCGIEYFAASADLSDDLFSVSSERAREIGLEPLEAIVLPRRALAVDGAWPSSPGYPFAHPLVLAAASPRGGSLPRELVLWIKASAARAAAADAEPLLLSAAGDIQVGEAQGPALLGGEAGIRSLLRGDIVEALRQADLAFANLESPVSSRGEPNPKKRYRFHAPPGASAALKDAGFGLMLFGNNHALDFGPDAFNDTLGDLKKAGLPMVGAGRNLTEAAAARFIEPRRNARLAFVGYAFFPNESYGFSRSDAAAGPSNPGISADEGAAMRSVRDAAATGAFVVVLAHGGSEYVERPSDAARELYARFADAGASLIVGTHPHVLQGCEARSGALIAYSLGNFLFTGETEPPEALKGAMLDFLEYRGKVRGVAPRPIVAGYYFTERDDDRDAAEARFSRLCSGIAALPPLRASGK
jgi:poly-gamma-glutamate synthesis protein (capsule biosynthesis protein)